MSWPNPTAASTVSGTAGAPSDLGPSVIIPAGSVNVPFRGAGNGAIGDTIKAIRFRNKGAAAATTVTITDGDGMPYADPRGGGGLIPNPYNNLQIQGPNAGLQVPDYIMYNRPSYSGAYYFTTGADVDIEIFGDAS